MRYNNDVQTLLFSQRLLGAVEEYSTIGASAPVEKVLVRGVEGEFVVGGWRIAENQQDMYTPIPGTQTSLGVYWDPKLPQLSLRWRVGDMAYELLSTGGSGLEKNDLITIAENLR